MYSSANYRATTHVVTLPIPRTAGVGSARLRDTELVDYLVAFLRAILPVE
jgi:transcription-repair coupling factor (superfamily II helicase)